MGGHQIHWLPLALAAMLALLGFWLNQLTHQTPKTDNGGFAHEPDTIVQNFNALTFTQTGQPQYRLQARKLTHFLDDDTTQLEKPHFILLDPNQSRVEVHAQRGQISSHGDHVHFLGDVRMNRQDPSGSPLVLQTEYLWVTPDAGIMRTDKRVTLKQGSATLIAGAMLANSHSKTVTLSGGVQGNYEKSH